MPARTLISAHTTETRGSVTCGRTPSGVGRTRVACRGRGQPSRRPKRALRSTRQFARSGGPKTVTLKSHCTSSCTTSGAGQDAPSDAASHTTAPATRIAAPSPLGTSGSACRWRLWRGASARFAARTFPSVLTFVVTPTGSAEGRTTASSVRSACDGNATTEAIASTECRSSASSSRWTACGKSAS
jgi:hypothetical protein